MGGLPGGLILLCSCRFQMGENPANVLAASAAAQVGGRPDSLSTSPDSKEGECVAKPLGKGIGTQPPPPPNMLSWFLTFLGESKGCP